MATSLALPVLAVAGANGHNQPQPAKPAATGHNRLNQANRPRRLKLRLISATALAVNAHHIRYRRGWLRQNRLGDDGLNI